MESFDFSYFRRDLARPGYLALQQIKEQYRTSNPSVAARIQAMYAGGNDIKTPAIEDFSKAIHVIGARPPDSLLTEIYKNETNAMWKVQQTQQYYLSSVDLDHDGNDEYLLIRQQGSYYANVTMYFMENKNWRSTSVRREESAENLDALFYEELAKGKIELRQPRWDKIKIGKWVFKVYE